MNTNDIDDCSIFDSGHNTLAAKQDERDNENYIGNEHFNSSAEIDDNVGSVITSSNDSVIISPVPSIVDNSKELVSVDEKHERYSEDNCPIEVASSEIGLINSNCDSESAGCDVLVDNNSNDVFYESLLNDNICMVFDDNNNRIDEEASILIEELVRRTIETNKTSDMHSYDDLDDEDEEVVNIGTIDIKRPSLHLEDDGHIKLEGEGTIDVLDGVKSATSCDHDRNEIVVYSREENVRMEVEENPGPGDVATDCIELTASSTIEPNTSSVNGKLEDVIRDVMDESYLVSYLISDASKSENSPVEDTITKSIVVENESENMDEYDYTHRNEEGSCVDTVADKNQGPIHEDVFPQIYLDKSKNDSSTYHDDVFTDKEMLTDQTNTPRIPTLSTSEIIVLFPRLRTASGRSVSMNYDSEHSRFNVRSETEVNIPFKGEKSIRTLSTSSFELLAQKYLMRGRFVSGLMSVDKKSLNGADDDINKKWCYILRNSADCRSKQWRYNVMVDKQPCQLSFQVIEDPTAVERWETSTFELMNTTTEKVQLESEWVLINCSHDDIELFTAHQNELSYKQEPPSDQPGDKGCAVS